MPPDGIGSVDRVNTDLTYRATQPVERDESSGFSSVLSVVANRAINPPEARVQPISKQDVRMRFVIDPQSKNVTVLIFDRSTQKVLRTIPPEELSQMMEGELVDLVG